MTKSEYVELFHQLGLNKIAFLRLMNCNEEVLKLVNVAIEDAVAKEREACAKLCDERAKQSDIDDYQQQSDAEYGCAAAIRARGEK